MVRINLFSVRTIRTHLDRTMAANVNAHLVRERLIYIFSVVCNQSIGINRLPLSMQMSPGQIC